MKKAKGTAAFLLGVALVSASAESGAARRADVERSLKQRYRLTVIGTGMLGFTGDRSSIREAGGILSLRRAALSLSPPPPPPPPPRRPWPTPPWGKPPRRSTSGCCRKRACARFCKSPRPHRRPSPHPPPRPPNSPPG